MKGPEGIPPTADGPPVAYLFAKKGKQQEVVSMVTYEALFADTTVIIAIIALVVSIFQNNK